jgi:hypothetical protein
MQAFEMEGPGRHLIMVPLGGKRIFGLAIDSRFISEDAGRTWSGPSKVLVENSGAPLPPEDLKNAPIGDFGLMTGQLESRLLSICKLASGKLGGILSEAPKDFYSDYPHIGWNRMFFVTSDDEGKTWKGKVPIGRPVEHLELINSMVQLKSGRILAPMNWFISDYDHEEYRGLGHGGSFKGGYGTYQGRTMMVEGHGHTPEFGAITIMYSDDQGQSWKSSPNNLWVWPLPAEANVGGHSALYEPVVVELDNNRVLMMCRSTMGRIYQSLSKDGGVHWSVPQPTELVSSDSPSGIVRMPTGDLVIIWNQVSGDEIIRGLKRSRINCAISKDRGTTWTNFKTLDCAGLPPVEKIEPGPIRHYHSLDYVGIVPDDFGGFDYPNLTVVGDTVIFAYNAQRVLPVSEWTEETGIAGERKYWGQIKAFPVSWFYE